MDAEKLARLREAANEFATYARLEYEQLVALRDLLAAHDALAKRVERLEHHKRAADEGYAELEKGRDAMRAKVAELQGELKTEANRVEWLCERDDKAQAELAQLRAKVEELEAERLLFRIERDDNAVLAHDAERERDELRAALAKISAIRDDIVGRQRVNWSAHIYPLVAALGEAGFPGVGYDQARAEAMTANDVMAKQEAELEELRAVIARVREKTAEWRGGSDGTRTTFTVCAEELEAVLPREEG